MYVFVPNCQLYLSQIAQYSCKICSHHVVPALADRSSYMRHYQVLPGYCVCYWIVMYFRFAFVWYCLEMHGILGSCIELYGIAPSGGGVVIRIRHYQVLPPPPSSFIKCSSPIMKSFQLPPSCTLTLFKTPCVFLSANQQPINPQDGWEGVSFVLLFVFPPARCNINQPDNFYDGKEGLSSLGQIWLAPSS